jgi:hypothetical protein
VVFYFAPKLFQWMSAVVVRTDFVLNESELHLGGLFDFLLSLVVSFLQNRLLDTLALWE